MRCLILLCLFNLTVLAQTDYAYTVVGHPEDGARALYATTFDDTSIREIPGEVYPLTESADDRGTHLIRCIAITEPGPFLYVIREEPNEIYSFRRLSNGKLEPLDSGEPIRIDSPELDRLTWAEVHPTLPILYVANWRGRRIHSFHIGQDGRLEEAKTSPFETFPATTTMPFVFRFHPDGDRIFFAGTLFDMGLFSMTVNQQGMIESLTKEVDIANPATVAITADGQYLFASFPTTNLIHRYRIEGNQLISLGEPFDTGLFIGLLTIKGSFIAVGDSNAVWTGILIHDGEGGLSWGPNSPLWTKGGTNIHHDFTTHSNRVVYAGNSYLEVFDLMPDGRLEALPYSRFLGTATWKKGIAVAPELIGTPRHLAFERFPELGDRNIYLSGDPFTPFALEVNGTCVGTFQTDASGHYLHPLEITPDTRVAIKAYCEDSSSLLSSITVPLLKPTGLLILILAFLTTSLYLARKPS